MGQLVSVLDSMRAGEAARAEAVRAEEAPAARVEAARLSLEAQVSTLQLSFTSKEGECTRLETQVG